MAHSIYFIRDSLFFCLFEKAVSFADPGGAQILGQKGSACVEAFHNVTHMVANFFGDPDGARRHKEVKVNQDLEALVSEIGSI
jgi:hypothetical protein